MSDTFARRDILKWLGVGAASSLAPASLAGWGFDRGQLQVFAAPISPLTIRVTLAESGVAPLRIPRDGSLVEEIAARDPSARTGKERFAFAPLQVHVQEDPLVIQVKAPDGRLVQQLKVNLETGALQFALGDAPALGLGQGGPQFDRRGHLDRMRSGQGGYRLRTHGGRVPVQWLIGTSGWAMFIHQPLGSFDLTGAEGQFIPFSRATAFPMDLFVVDARDPVRAMAEYARLTGYPEMPPLWSLGYQQSHRTLADRAEILGIAKTFREKNLPCDVLIYLGTGFTPSGWNTANGSFQFNSRVFDDPKAILDELHALHFRVVLHSVILTRTLRGRVTDPCPVERFDMEEASCAWNAHRKTFALGVDGWWPDEGDPLDAASRLARNRMHYEGPQLDRPNERPYALHRNGHAGMQRYAAFLWSGDVYSTWETLRTHVPVAINTGLSGIPLWGTDIGGFVPTREFTGELYVRWFQFGAFCPLFRSHGRTWKLRLPWGWNTGELGPNEISNYAEAANPDPAELRNPEVEPICRKYLELRYRLLPYLYSVVREGCETGLPVIRALWLHYPDDPKAVERGDEFLWGRDILVAPVTEKGATHRQLYLPRGDWFDFWTEERTEGGRELRRAVDLATVPLYVRAGSIIPFGPVKQYTAEKVDEPITLVIYPGADGAFSLYEDDGISFAYRRGMWVKTQIAWDNARRRLLLSLARGSRPGASGLPPRQRQFRVRLAGESSVRTIDFAGVAAELPL